MLAQDYAAFSGRNTPYAGDLARAQAESGWDVGRLKREAKKRRIGESDLAQCTLHVVCLRRKGCMECGMEGAAVCSLHHVRAPSYRAVHVYVQLSFLCIRKLTPSPASAHGNRAARTPTAPHARLSPRTGE